MIILLFLWLEFDLHFASFHHFTQQPHFRQDHNKEAREGIHPKLQDVQEQQLKVGDVPNFGLESTSSTHFTSRTFEDANKNYWRNDWSNPCHYFSRVMSCFFVTTHTFSFCFQPLGVFKSKGGDQKCFPFHHFPLANVTKNRAIAISTDLSLLLVFFWNEWRRTCCCWWKLWLFEKNKVQQKVI